KVCRHCAIKFAMSIEKKFKERFKQINEKRILFKPISEVCGGSFTEERKSIGKSYRNWLRRNHPDKNQHDANQTDEHKRNTLLLIKEYGNLLMRSEDGAVIITFYD
uniref:J domain-containing protein n=2 Tax=Clytia hemisphaerica TaxID=252671 RepID=A0A7M5TUP1_9CNID